MNQFIIIFIILISLSLAIFLLIYFLLLRDYNIISSKIKHITISISDLNFEEAESLMDSKIIEKNHFLLNQTIENINSLLIFCNDTGLEINEIEPNMSFALPDFLENPTTQTLKVVKSDVELYKKSYEDLALNMNNFTKEVSESLKNLSFPLNEMKDEINKVLLQFKDLIKNLCIPLILEQKGLISKNTKSNINEKLRILTINEQIEEYKNQTENLNLLYNDLFQYLNQESQIIENEIKGIQNLTTDFQNIIEEEILQNKDKLTQFSQLDNVETFHRNLIDIKASFISSKNYFNGQQNSLQENSNNFENGYRSRKFDFEEFQNKSDEIIENLTIISNSIKTDIISMNENETNIGIPDLNASSIIVEHIKKSLDSTVQIIKKEEIKTAERIEAFISITNVEIKTSLDLLFVIDMTGSMKPYIEEAKKNIINIMDRIIKECPGVDINLAFIGYRDIYETTNNDYINIDFTKNHQQLQNSIKNIKASGGEGDGPEDVAWAMEMALYKSWKNNARFLIFIADAPCHGYPKYNNIPQDKYPDGYKNRRFIEELIKELAEKNISLFCMKITQDTDIMYNIFSNIYKDFNDCEYKIVSISNGQSMSNIIVNSATEVYVSKRNVDI